MPSYGRASRSVFETIHHDLQIIATDLIEVYDVSLIGGARTVERQIENIRRRVSKTLDSRHIPRDDQGRYDPNAPAMALDLVPYAKGVNPWPQDSDAPDVRQKKAHRFYFAQGIIFQIAATHGIEIRQGIDWNRDADLFDQKFDDLPHVELVRDGWPRLVVDDETLLEMANEALRARGLPEHRA